MLFRENGLHVFIELSVIVCCEVRKRDALAEIDTVLIRIGREKTNSQCKLLAVKSSVRSANTDNGSLRGVDSTSQTKWVMWFPGIQSAERCNTS